jgi:hypothetical protein
VPTVVVGAEVLDLHRAAAPVGAEVGGVDGLQRRDVGVPGVVYYHVQTAEGVHGGLDRVPGGAGAGHVEGDRADQVAVLADEVLELAGVARGGDELVPGRQDRAGEGAAGAAAASRDEPYLGHGARLPY